MRTLHPACRVTDLTTSLEFYFALGYKEVGRVAIGHDASLTMLKFPDEEAVSLELVHRPVEGPVDLGNGFSHLAVEIEDLNATIEALSRAGLRPGHVERPGGPEGPQTSWLVDPTATAWNWCSGRPGMPAGSRPPTFAEARW